MVVCQRHELTTSQTDLTLARYTCVALQRLNGSAKKVKGTLITNSSVSYRYRVGQAPFSTRHSAWRWEIPFSKNCKMPLNIPVVPKNGLGWRSRPSIRFMPLAIAPTSCVTGSSRISPTAHSSANYNHRHQTCPWAWSEIRIRWRRTQSQRHRQALHHTCLCHRLHPPRRRVRRQRRKMSAMYSTSASSYSSSGMLRSNTSYSLSLSNGNGNAKRTRKCLPTSVIAWMRRTRDPKKSRSSTRLPAMLKMRLVNELLQCGKRNSCTGHSPCWRFMDPYSSTSVGALTSSK